MARIEKSIIIKTSPEKIWELIFWDRIPEWMDIIKKAKYTSKERNKVGATAHIIGENAGIKAEWDVEITEYVEKEKATWRSTAGNFTAIGLTILNTTKTGTKLTLMMDYDLPYSILGKVVDKLLVSREIEKGVGRALEKLKNILEK